MVKTKKNNYRKRRQTRCKHPNHCKKPNHYKNQKGGSPSGYTIVGFSGVINNSREGAMMPADSSGMGNLKNVPICLPDHEIPGSLIARIGGSIILPELYKVEWVHGKLEFLKSIKRGINFYDRNENLVFPILPWQEHPPEDKIKLEKWFNEKISPGSGETRRDIIQDIEATYPGLFIPIFPADESRYHYAYDKTYTQSV
jgi:hypothetical protein